MTAPRYFIKEIPHPLPVGTRVEFGGTKGTVKRCSWEQNHSQGGREESHVTVVFDDQADPRKPYKFAASRVREISAVEQLGELAG